MRVRDAAERLVWTFVAGFFGALAAGQLLDLDLAVWQAAAIAGVADVVNAVTLLARWRLSVLPDPGAFL